MNTDFLLAAADMDGTLLNSERKITKRTQETIKKVIDRGVYFVPATGRAVNALPEELKAIEGIRYGIFSNGATVYDRSQRIFPSQTFPACTRPLPATKIHSADGLLLDSPHRTSDVLNSLPHSALYAAAEFPESSG